MQPIPPQPFSHLCSSKARVRQSFSREKKPNQGKAIKNATYSRKLQTSRQNFKQEPQPRICLRCQPGGHWEHTMTRAQAPSSCVTCHQVSHVSRCSCTPSALPGSDAGTGILLPGVNVAGYLSQSARCCLRAQASTKAKAQLKAALPANKENTQRRSPRQPCPGSSGLARPRLGWASLPAHSCVQSHHQSRGMPGDKPKPAFYSHSLTNRSSRCWCGDSEIPNSRVSFFLSL